MHTPLALAAVFALSLLSLPGAVRDDPELDAAVNRGGVEPPEFIPPPGVPDPRAPAPEDADPPPVADEPPAEEPPAPAEQSPPDAAPRERPLAAVKTEQERLAAENALEEERLKHETATLRAEVQKLQLEKERLTEMLAIDELNRKAAGLELHAKFESEKERLEREALLAKSRAEKLTNELKARKAEWQMKSAKLEAEIKDLEVRKKREAYANAKPKYPGNPLDANGRLVISDRRIELDGPITYRTADEVTVRINYFNNKNPRRPIFLVITDSPGGSVMSGYRILKAMEGSTAPVFVVVKSFAASMAATIATLAEQSYAYPNAVLLHHQLSMRLIANLNLVEQEELLADSRKWWERLAGPICQKMGITLDEFIERMYENSSRGDWSAFADEARELRWIDHVVTSIHETALLENPDVDTTLPSKPATSLVEELDEDGHPVMFLPRLNPRDFYFIYNPDDYYRLR